MKVGDLVKHPAGMLNVDAKAYSCGVILGIKEIFHAGCRRAQVEVFWLAALGAMMYDSTSLEVISENR